MLTRPSLRAVVATSAAAALLVGGANLASYAATHHGRGGGQSAAAKSSVPKTITFTLGKPGKTYAGGTVHLVSAKVPKGTYEIAMSGFIVDPDIAPNDSYSCLLADRKTLIKGLHGGFTTASFSHVYSLDGDTEGEFKFGSLNNYNPAQKIDRPTIGFGCIFSGSSSFTVARTLTFTLRPVQLTHTSTSPILVANKDAHRLNALLH